MFLGDKAFWLALFFLIGIALASLNAGTYLVFIFIIVAAVFLFLKQIRQVNFDKLFFSASDKAARFQFFKIALVLSIFIFIGFFYFHFFEAWNRENIIFNQPLKVSALIIENPEIKLKTQEFWVELHPPFKGKVFIYLPVQPAYHYGDIIELEGKIQKNQRGRNQMFYPKIEKIGELDGRQLKLGLFNAKSQLIANLNRVLPPSSAALAAGMLFGDRSRFKPEFEEKLIKTGTIHLVALSGMHVLIIISSLNMIFSRFISKRKNFYLTLLIILFFVLMTGGQPSMIRAALMAGLVGLSEQFNRLYNPRNAIVLTALIMVLFNPRLLIFDLGFQLSFLALLGIIYLSPFVGRIIKGADLANEGFLKWRHYATTTLAAQAPVLPFLFFKFGQFSWFSVLPNVLILPLVPLITGGGFLTAAVGFISFPLSQLMGLFLNLLLKYEIGVINFFAAYF